MSHRMITRYYEINARGISSPVHMALVTDLHSCHYGEGQAQLISAIDAQAPDLVLMSGDIFDDRLANTNTELFLAGISGRYPCYYVTGNHEYYGKPGEYEIRMYILKKYGVAILSNACETVYVRGSGINLCGVDDPVSYMVRFDRERDPQGYQKARARKMDTFHGHLHRLAEQAQKPFFTVLLSHRPELFESYVSEGFDLVLCGHAHGGQWRIPGVLNGLYAPHQGLFPPYAGGSYRKDNTVMIVSRGLARETVLVPRIFNPPELVVITLK